MAKKKYHSDPRRALERSSAGMISEDRSAPSNLPREWFMKYYPDANYGMDESLNDDIRGVDNQIRADGRGEKKGSMPEKDSAVRMAAIFLWCLPCPNKVYVSTLNTKFLFLSINRKYRSRGSPVRFVFRFGCFYF